MRFNFKNGYIILTDNCMKIYTPSIKESLYKKDIKMIFNGSVENEPKKETIRVGTKVGKGAYVGTSSSYYKSQPDSNYVGIVYSKSLGYENKVYMLNDTSAQSQYAARYFNIWLKHEINISREDNEAWRKIKIKAGIFLGVFILLIMVAYFM